MQLHRLSALTTRSPDEAGGEGTGSSTTDQGSLSGDATQAAAAGADTVAGAAGGDTVAAASGTDTVAGGEGADSLKGGAGDDALAVVPETPEGYVFEVSDKAKSVLGNMEGDPALKVLREAAKEKGWNQGQFNDRISETVNILAEKGLLQPNFDAAAETAKLTEGGQEGKARQQEVQVFADSLLARKDIDADQHAELMSLMPTAAGVRLVESLRKMASEGRMPAAPSGGDGGTDALAQARAMRDDPKYGSDPVFRKQADAAYVAATRRS